MTQEEKAKRYDEALKRASNLHKNAFEMENNMTTETCEIIFPELTKSEDEKIRKALIEHFSWNTKQILNEFSNKKTRAWLEKQGLKSNPYSGVSFEYNGYTFGMCARDGGVEILMDRKLKAFVSLDKSFIYPMRPKSAREAIKEEKVDNQNCVNPVDMVEPKFKVGDWVVVNNKHQSIYQVEKIENGYYILRHTYGGTFRVCILHDESLRLWTIQDAKDGDILVDSIDDYEVPLIFILKRFEKINSSDYSSHCFLTAGVNKDSQKFKLGHYHHMHNIEPATREQREFLFQRMKEAECEWDELNRKVKKIGDEPLVIDEGKAEIDRNFTEMMLKHYSDQNPANKFGVGDWIVTPENKILQITSIEGTSYRFNNESHYWEICYCDEKCRLWTIDDAKDGDVLVASDGSIFLFAGIDDCACKYYVALTTDNYVKINKEEKSGYWETSRAVHPATKEQHDTFIKAMANAGYTFDFEKKELKEIEDEPENFKRQVMSEMCDLVKDYIQQNPTDWSEEDGYIIEEIEAIIDAYVLEENNPKALKNWLKSLKDRVQPQQEWSEKDENILKAITYTVKNSGYKHCMGVSNETMLNWLKSLRSQKTWKPSDEQIIVIQEAIGIVGQLTPRGECLKELAEQLKKLKE